MAFSKNNPKPHVLVLTTGLSGSSVVTGLISRAGYCTGEQTVFKNNSTGKYETFENTRFVELNDLIISKADVNFDSKSWYEKSIRDKFTKLYDLIDLKEFHEFIAECDFNKPWVLKDPKLWVTIGFWMKLLRSYSFDFKCILITRDINQLWISQTNKRIIYDYFYLKSSETRSKHDLVKFLNDNSVQYEKIVYDSLIENPSEGIDKINKFLGSHLTIKDWNNIYQPKKKYELALLFKSLLIYIMNFSERIK